MDFVSSNIVSVSTVDDVSNIVDVDNNNKNVLVNDVLDENSCDEVDNDRKNISDSNTDTLVTVQPLVDTDETMNAMGDLDLVRYDGEQTARDEFGDISFRPSVIVLYSPPVQRQTWGETQILPRVDWGDLFFDLFYVAATYNITNLIVGSPDRFGFLYSTGIYWTLQGIMNNRSFYDARFVVNRDDIYHRAQEVFQLILLSFTVLTIRPVSILSNPSKYISMFVFSMALTLERLLLVSRYIEVYFKGVGQDTLKRVALRDITTTFTPIPFYIASAVIAGLYYFDNNNDSSASKHAYYDGSSSTNETGYNTSTSHNGGYNNSNNSSYNDSMAHLRWLAGSDSSSSSSYAEGESYTSTKAIHAPIYLCLFGYIFSVAVQCINIICCLPGNGLHKQISVPLNIDFMIHRQSEWIMLNLGESIFSLLIVHNLSREGQSYNTVFYCGVVTVIFLYVLHFHSQPLHADHHALRRHKNAGVLHTILMHMYSLGLLSLGAAFTFFLSESETSYNDYTSDSIKDDYNGSAGHRWRTLAGGDTTSSLYTEDVDKYYQNIAKLYCISLANIFASLDLMTLTHLGLHESENRCYCKHSKRINLKGFFLIFLRFALVIFTATMDLWQKDIRILSIIGLVLVIIQIGQRKLGALFLSSHLDNSNHHS